VAAAAAALASTPKKEHPTARTFLSLAPNRFIYCAMRDSLSHIPEGSTEKYVTANTWNGRQKITPEQYIQGVLAARPDVCVPLSDLIPSGESLKRVKKSVDRSLVMLDRHLEALGGSGIPVFGVVQGSRFPEERARSAQETAKRNPAGFSLEGHGCGEPEGEFVPLLERTLAHLPADKVRVLHGMFTPPQILAAVGAGIDIVDGAYPLVVTELGHALTFSLQAPGATRETEAYRLNLWDPAFSRDKGPLLPGCACYACQHHTRAYVHHLLNTRELLASVLLMSHNLHHFWGFFAEIRAATKDGAFKNKTEAFLKAYLST